MTVLEALGVSKAFGGKKVVDEVSLKASSGQVIAILGPNGAGKTTLLRIFGGLERPDSGRVLLDGLDLNDPRIDGFSLRRRMGFVFQRTLLFDGSVAFNVEYGLRIRGIGRQEARKRAEEAIRRLGLQGLSKHHASTLSGGEAQRVALAQVLVLEPQVLLLDEPTANLDPGNTRLVEELLMDLRAEASTAIVMATHNVFQAKRLADTVAFMLEGRLLELGSPEKVLEAPRNAKFSQFVRGEML